MNLLVIESIVFSSPRFTMETISIVSALIFIATTASAYTPLQRPKVLMSNDTETPVKRAAADGHSCDFSATNSSVCDKRGPCMECVLVEETGVGRCVHAAESECQCPEESPAPTITWLDPCHQWEHRCPDAAACRVAHCSSQPRAVFYDDQWNRLEDCAQLPVSPARQGDQAILCNELPLSEFHNKHQDDEMCADHPKQFWYYLPSKRNCLSFKTCGKIHSLNAFETQEDCLRACRNYPPCNIIVPMDVRKGCEIEQITDGNGCTQAYVNCTSESACAEDYCPPCHQCSAWGEGGFACQPLNTSECAAASQHDALQGLGTEASLPVPSLEQARKCRALLTDARPLDTQVVRAAALWQFNRDTARCELSEAGAEGRSQLQFDSEQRCQDECGAVRACPNVTKGFNTPVTGLCSWKSVEHADGCMERVQMCTGRGCDSPQALQNCRGPCARCDNLVVAGMVRKFKCNVDKQCAQYACANMRCGVHKQCVYDMRLGGTKCVPDAVSQIACRQRPQFRQDCPMPAGEQWHYDAKSATCVRTADSHCVDRLGFPFDGTWNGRAVRHNGFESSDKCEQRCGGTQLCRNPLEAPPLPGCYHLHSVDDQGCPTAEMICEL